MGIPLKSRNTTTHDPTTPLVGVYPEETVIEKDTCTPVFIAALFTITRTGKPGMLQFMGSQRVGHD